MKEVKYRISDIDQVIRYNVPEEYKLTRKVYGSGQGYTATKSTVTLKDNLDLGKSPGL